LRDEAEEGGDGVVEVFLVVTVTVVRAGVGGVEDVFGDSEESSVFLLPVRGDSFSSAMVTVDSMTKLFVADDGLRSPGLDDGDMVRRDGVLPAAFVCLLPLRLEDRTSAATPLLEEFFGEEEEEGKAMP
jgi:hypothetical protein